MEKGSDLSSRRPAWPLLSSTNSGRNQIGAARVAVSDNTLDRSDTGGRAVRERRCGWNWHQPCLRPPRTQRESEGRSGRRDSPGRRRFRGSELR